MRRLLLLACLLASCAAGGGASRPGSEPFQVGLAVGIHPRYQGHFEALRDAVEDQENETGRSVLAQLMMRLEVDRDLGLEEADPALKLAEGFERILDGRARVSAVRLRLVQRPVDDEHAVRLVLEATSAWPQPLVLEPGAATLKVHRTLVTPGGRESHVVRKQGLRGFETLWIDPEGESEISLGTFPLYLTNDVLAGRTEWVLELLSGSIRENDVTFPAMRVAVERTERTDLAHFLPNGTVEPADLAAYLARHDVAMPPIMERTVRVHPDRREEALDALESMVATATIEQLARLAPTLRWLSRTSQPSGDPLAWRDWMAERRARREGARGATPGLDISGR